MTISGTTGNITTGGGNDNFTISGNTGNLISGAGDDYFNITGNVGDITSQGGNDNFTITGTTGDLNGGTGNDSFTISGSGTIGTIDAGDNSDSLTVSSFSGTLGALSDIENITFTDYAFANSITGVSNLTINNSSTVVSGPISMTSNDDTLTMNNNASVSSTVDFGVGNDTLIYNYAGSFSADSNYTNLENIRGDSSDQTWTASNSDSGFSTVNMMGGTDLLNIGIGVTIDSARYSGFENINVSGTVTDSVTLEDGANNFTISGSTGNLNGGTGDDTFIVSGSGTIGNIDGGSDNDSLTVNTFTGDLGDIANIEIINLNSSSIDSNITGTDSITVNSDNSITGLADFGTDTDDILTLDYSGTFDASNINIDLGLGVNYNNLDIVQGNNSDQTWTVTTNDLTLNYIDFGEGNDTLVIGSGMTVSGNDIGANGRYRGFDIITILGEVTGSVNLGAGDQTLTFDNNANGSDLIDLGEGNDTLLLEGSGNFSASRMNSNLGLGVIYQNVENILGDSNSQTWSVTANDSTLNTIDLAGGSDTLNIGIGNSVNSSDINSNTLYRGIDNLNVSGTLSGDIDLTSVDSLGSTINVSGNTGNITTGSGDDIFIISGSGTVGNIDSTSGTDSLTFSTFTGNIRDINNFETVAISSSSISGNISGVQTLDVYGSDTTLNGSLIFTSTDNTATLNNGALLSNSVNFGEGIDTLTYNYSGSFTANSNHTNLEIIQGNETDQQWTVSSEDQNITQINFLDGTDTLIINEGINLTAGDFGNRYQNFENINLAGQVTGNLTFNSTDDTLNLFSTAQHETIDFGDGNDTVVYNYSGSFDSSRFTNLEIIQGNGTNQTWAVSSNDSSMTYIDFEEGKIP